MAKKPIEVEALKHGGATRKNIPTAEFESVMQDADKTPIQLAYLSITDRGFFDYAQKHQADGKLNELQRFIRSQNEVYLRIGVGRQFKSGDRDGYWLQVNGIYTFPNFLDEIRSY